MSTTRKSTRTKKTEDVTEIADITATKQTKILDSTFTDLLNKICQAKSEFEDLQKEIAETKEAWVKEQRNHEIAIVERNQQEEITRKRELETYDYETKLARKKAEDEFLQRKNAWERELAENKDRLANERKELEELRKQVINFDTEKEKAIKTAVAEIQKNMQEKFDMEKKLREQEFKSEKELLALKITNHVQENTRLNQEVTKLQKSLDETTRQLKEVAVRVIDSNRPQSLVPPKASEQ